jgi:hypothetical protein
VCTKKFFDKRSLEAHILGSHKIGDPFVCPNCSEDFWWKKMFYKHKKKCDLQNREQVSP